MSMTMTSWSKGSGVALTLYVAFCLLEIRVLNKQFSKALSNFQDRICAAFATVLLALKSA